MTSFTAQCQTNSICQPDTDPSICAKATSLAKDLQSVCGSDPLCPAPVAATLEQLTRFFANDAQFDAKNGRCEYSDPACTFCKRWFTVDESICSKAEDLSTILVRDICIEGLAGMDDLNCMTDVAKLLAKYFA